MRVDGASEFPSKTVGSPPVIGMLIKLSSSMILISAVSVTAALANVPPETTVRLRNTDSSPSISVSPNISTVISPELCPAAIVN